MAARFANKVALITGASSGIGAEVGRAFAREGAKVLLASRREERGNAIAQEICAAGGEASFVRADMSRRQDIEDMVGACIGTYGRLDVAFNNAGIAGEVGLSTADYPESTWDDVLAVNLTGVWLCMRAQLSPMRKQGRGAIVNMSSLGGLKGFTDCSAYVASKFGVVGITKAAALEYAAHGIRINAVCPGMIDTDMATGSFLRDPASAEQILGTYPMGRVGTVAEVSAAVLWLASDEASYVTGTALPIDGGSGA